MIFFSLKTPPELIALRLVQSFISESANICGFERDKLSLFDLIAEEGFTYVVRLLKSEEESSDITIETKIDDRYFIISFFDKGMPFPKEEELSEIEKIGLNIIKAYSKKLLWINQGKNGKELRILFNKPQKDITQYDIFADDKKQKPSNDISIEILKPEDAYKVSRIIYKTYGYTYPNGDMYYPEFIEAVNKNKDIISVVAVDKQCKKIVGHYAIEKLDCKDIVELGQTVVDPDYRGKNLAKLMRKKLEGIALGLKIKGMFTQPVASHTRTQKINEEFNSKVCGVSFGLVPKEFNYKKMEIKPVTERESCFLYFKPLVFEKRFVYLPSRHMDMLNKIYNHLGFELQRPKNSSLSEKSRIDAKYNAAWGFGTINVFEVGSNLSLEIKNTFNRLKLSTQAEAIFLNISLNDAPLDEYIGKIEELGFFFCGIAPYILNGKDAVRFEYLNTLIDTNRIKVYGDFAKELFNYSVSMMKKVLW